MRSKAIVLTGGYLNTNNAKTAHGLIRGTERFEIVGIIDHNSAGKDAGEVMDGKFKGIPVFATIPEFFDAGGMAESCVVGVATKGGVIPDSLRIMLRDALEHGLNLVNGLHEFISDIPELVSLAHEKGLTITDVRKPKRFKDLHFWTGRIKEVKCPKIAVLGTDCALGKRTTARILTQAMQKAGYRAEMIYTGQTGWMQGARYGFVFDSTLNDFVSGELEHAVVTCYNEVKPDILFLEGQSSLTNPSGPAGAEWIVSADATAVILQHDPGRLQYKDMEHYPAYIPSLPDVIKMIEMYGSKTVAITLNTGKVGAEEARRFASGKQAELGIPIVLPLEDGVDALVPMLIKLIEKTQA